MALPSSHTSGTHRTSGNSSPHFVQQLDVRRLRVGPAQVDLHYELNRDGTVAVSVEKVDGPLNVEVEPRTPA